MTPRILATRMAIANDQLAASATQLAQTRNMPVDGLNAVHRDPAIQQLLRLEALADMLMKMVMDEAPKRARKEPQP